MINLWSIIISNHIINGKLLFYYHYYLVIYLSK